MDNTKELLDVISNKAGLTLPEDVDGDCFCVDDYAGGNVDDAYELGIRAGKTRFAKELIESFPDAFAS